ncbi:TRAP transporter small permease [Pseudooceanicola spongiae]|uniref:TRAP transporter small permease protein n=1 Tax=Pseudooceanicola spongiae TaxID=2613965 RepID=A0A7L9WNY6_9RHOB|nr:TRAP transporter small permease subunit [Pseudooceanicola spongiae]QOL80820.1 TRAP transporter small permease subunit [Pseudooceanicola spongiae]
MLALSNTLGRISDTVDRVMRGVALVFLVVMVLAISLQVVARYGFAAPPSWTEEAARYAMVWVGLLGASISFKAGFDPKLVKLPVRTPRAILAVAAVMRGAAVVTFLGPILFFCFYGPGMNPARSFLARNLYTTAESFDLPTIFVAVTVPIFIVAIFLHGLASCAASLTALRHTDQEKDAHAPHHA